MKKRSSPSLGNTKRALLLHDHGYHPKTINVGLVSQVLASRTQELVSMGKRVSKHTGSADVAICDESDTFHILKVNIKHGKLSSVDVVLRSFPARNHGEIAGFKSVHLKDKLVVSRRKRSTENKKASSEKI